MPRHEIEGQHIPESLSQRKSLRTEYIQGQGQFLFSFEQIDASVFSKIGGKGSNLVTLYRAGLPVPKGYCCFTDAHDYYTENGKLPDGLIDEITNAKKALGGKVAIRSDADCEDGTDLSMAGVFQSRYIYKDEDIPEAVEQIYKQSRSKEVDQFMTLHGKSSKNVKMALIIQKLIDDPEAAGVIYTGVNGDRMLVQYVDGFGARLVDGETQGSSMLVGPDNTISSSTGFETRPLPKSAVNQLANHTRKIENLFPGFPQDIEFAYKDGLVHILQARTLTADLGNVDLKETAEDTLDETKRKLRRLAAEEKRELKTPTAIFSDANYSELLPKPTEMDIGIHMYVWGGSDGIPGAKQLGHSAMGYLVGKEANPIISYIGGRTYFSIARNAGLYHIGFPETKEEYFSTLVREYLSAVQKDPEKGSYPQMGLYLQDPTLEDLKSRYGDRAMEYFQVYQSFKDRMGSFADQYLSEFQTKRLPETTKFVQEMKSKDIGGMTNEQLANYSMDILEHNRTKSYVDFVQGARLGFYYSQRLQNLLSQKMGISKEEAQKTYSRLNQGLDGSAITDANITIAEAPSDKDALQVAQELIGHYSSGEMLEIRHVPMRDDPDRLNAYVKGIRRTGNYKADFEKQKQERIRTQQTVLSSVPEQDRDELNHVINASQTYMAVRETAKYYFTKEYLLLRDALELLGERTGLEYGDIYHLYPRELPQLASDSRSMEHLIRSRKQSFKNYDELDMPHVIRESDIDNLGLKTDTETDFIEATGKFLAEGSTVTGVIVNADEFKTLEEVNAVLQQYHEQNTPVILAATQMNLSHDPLIFQSSGLIIENAGIVAHGAQRARELGKGAIGGIKTRRLKTGIEVIFDPENKTVKKLLNKNQESEKGN